ncbi:MAG: DUF1080 domain-containing protein, partial [Flavisolibacter sp.]
MIRQSKFFILILLTACAHSHKVSKIANGWIPLFNGHNLDGWTVKIYHHEVGDNFGNTFRAEDGMIKVRYDQYGDFNDQFAHLYYNEPLSYFDLKFDYRFTGEQQRGAPTYTLLNSGMMFHSQDP